MIIERIKDTADNGIGTGLDTAESVSAALVNDPNLGKVKGISRWGKFINNTSKLIKRKRNKDKQFSTIPDPKIDTGEVNKFNIALDRVSNMVSSKGGD